MANRALQLGLGTLIGLGVGALALFVALRGADMNEITAAFARAGWGTVVLGSLVHATVQLVYAARWRLLMDAEMATSRLFGVVALGYLANYTLPGRPGELVRAALARGLGGVPLALGLASLLLEKVLDGATILLSGLLFALSGETPDWLRSAIAIGAAAFAVGAGALAAAAALPGRSLPRGAPVLAFAAKQVEHLGAPARQLADPGRLVAVLLLGATSWLLILLHQAIICGGVGTGTGPASWLLLYAALGLASVVPGAPGYVGTYQLAAVLSLSAFGVAQEPAFVVATLYQLTRLLGALAVSAWAVAREGMPTLRRAL